MSTEYGRIILRNLRTERRFTDPWVEAAWRTTEERVDRWLLWMSAALLPILVIQLLEHSK